MGSAAPNPVDVWIVGFDIPLEEATERLARVFGLDAQRAAALAASVPRGVRRGLDDSAAAETVAALVALGARVEVLPAGRRPALVESLRPAPPRAGPRVALRRAAPTVPIEDEPAAAYVPFVASAEPRGASPRKVAAPLDLVDAERQSGDETPGNHDGPGAAPGEEAFPAGAELEGPDEVFFEDDLVLGSLIPAPGAAAELADVQLALARLPTLQGKPLGAQSEVTPARSPAAPGPGEALPTTLRAGKRRGAGNEAMQPPSAAAPQAEPALGSSSNVPRTMLWALGVVGLVLLALLLRRLLREDPTEGEHADPVAVAVAGDGPSDAQLLSRCEGLVLHEARIWLRLDERSHFAGMDGPTTRAFVNRLAAAGAINASVALENDSSDSARYLLLQHTPFHTDSLRAAATSGSAASVPAACLEVSERYMLIALEGCP